MQTHVLVKQLIVSVCECSEDLQQHFICVWEHVNLFENARAQVELLTAEQPRQNRHVDFFTWLHEFTWTEDFQYKQTLHFTGV